LAGSVQFMTSTGRSSGFSRNVVSNFMAYGFAIAVSFFLSPFIVEHLGATRFGVWSLLTGLVGYLGLLDLGIRQAVNTYMARHHALGAHGESASVVSVATRLYAFCGALAIGLSAVLAYAAPILFNIPEALVHDTRVILLLAGVTVAISLQAGVFGSVVSGLQRFDIQGALEILLTSCRAIAVVLALREGYGLLSLACINLAVSVLTWVLYRAAARRLYPELRAAFADSSRKTFGAVLSFSAFSVVVYACHVLAYNSGAVIIAAFLPIEAVTFFAIAANLWAQANSLTAVSAHLMVPRVSALASTGSGRLGEEIVAVAKLTTLFMAPIAATFVVRGESFIALWMGVAYGPASGEILGILAVVVWLGASRAVVMHSFTGLGKQQTLIPGFAVEAACCIALSFALVRSFGIVGVALGTVIPSVLVNLGYIPYRLKNATGVSVGSFYRNAVLLPTVACIPFALASAIVERYAPATNLWMFFAQVLLVLPLVPIATWIVCLTEEEKHQVRSVFRRVFPSAWTLR